MLVAHTYFIPWRTMTDKRWIENFIKENQVGKPRESSQQRIPAQMWQQVTRYRSKSGFWIKFQFLFNISNISLLSCSFSVGSIFWSLFLIVLINSTSSIWLANRFLALWKSLLSSVSSDLKVLSSMLLLLGDSSHNVAHASPLLSKNIKCSPYFSRKIVFGIDGFLSSAWRSCRYCSRTNDQFSLSHVTVRYKVRMVCITLRRHLF